MTIGVDIDNVLLYGYEDGFVDYMQQELEWGFNHQVFASRHNFREATGRTEFETNAAFVDYVRSGRAMRSIRPIPGAAAALAVLNQFFELHLVTGRSSIVDSFTRHELACHFPGLDLSSRFTSGHHGAKHVPLSQEKARVHIDDSPYEIKCLLQFAPILPVSSFFIIQFPRFNGQPVPRFSSSRVIRPASCDLAPTAATLEDKLQLYAQAWHEVLHLIAGLAL